MSPCLPSQTGHETDISWGNRGGAIDTRPKGRRFGWRRRETLDPSSPSIIDLGPATERLFRLHLALIALLLLAHLAS